MQQGEQEGASSEEDARMPAGDTDDSESVATEREKEVNKTLPATTSTTRRPNCWPPGLARETENEEADYQ